jgi:hypothetical protein
LQDRAPPRQGFRDLQEQPAFQGASALSGNLQIDVEGPRKRPFAFLAARSADHWHYVRIGMELARRFC